MIPAFPRPATVGPGWQGSHAQEGMSLLDYFAAKAMAAIIASPKFNLDTPHHTVAIMAYQTAQAMMEERKNHVI